MTPSHHIAAALLVIGSLCACASNVPAPSNALDAYRGAIQDNDPDTLYDLLEPSMRRSMTREEFRAFFKERRPQLLEYANELQNSQERIQTHALVSIRSGHTAPLTYTDGSWTIDSPTLSAPSTQGPVPTLLSFATALERGDFITALTFLTAQRRGAYTKELHSLSQNIQNGLNNNLIVDGDRATLTLRNSTRIVLVREGTTWKIDRIE